jgi:hypothetical protein
VIRRIGKDIQMKKSLLLAALLALVSTSHAGSSSSTAAASGVNPSSVTENGGFDFDSRDSGVHLGWRKGQGHLAPAGNGASGHRNHPHCDSDGGDDGGGDDDPLSCTEFQVYYEGQCVDLG